MREKYVEDSISVFVQLVSISLKQMNSVSRFNPCNIYTFSVLDNVIQARASMNDNFDLLELTTRRYFLQIGSMFPKQIPSLPPSKLIEDENVRAKKTPIFRRKKYGRKSLARMFLWSLLISFTKWSLAQVSLKLWKTKYLEHF
jgi:hypothetical protein